MSPSFLTAMRRVGSKLDVQFLHGSLSPKYTSEKANNHPALKFCCFFWSFVPEVHLTVEEIQLGGQRGSEFHDMFAVLQRSNFRMDMSWSISAFVQKATRKHGREGKDSDAVGDKLRTTVLLALKKQIY